MQSLFSTHWTEWTVHSCSCTWTLSLSTWFTWKGFFRLSFPMFQGTGKTARGENAFRCDSAAQHWWGFRIPPSGHVYLLSCLASSLSVSVKVNTKWHAVIDWAHLTMQTIRHSLSSKLDGSEQPLVLVEENTACWDLTLLFTSLYYRLMELGISLLNSFF